MQSTGHSELDTRLFEILEMLKYPGACFTPASVVCALAFIGGALHWLPLTDQQELKRRQDNLRPDIKNFGLSNWLLSQAFPNDLDYLGGTDQRVLVKDNEAVAMVAGALSSLIDKSQVTTP